MTDKDRRFSFAFLAALAIHIGLAAVVILRSRAREIEIRVESIELATDSATARPARPSLRQAQRATQESPQDAPPEITPAPPAAVRETSPNGISSSVMGAYFSSVRDRLSSVIPISRAGFGPPLKLLLKLTLLEDGGLRNSAIEQSSGWPEFDRSVLEAVGRAGPFPRFTKEMDSVHELTLHVPILVKRWSAP